MTGRGSRNPNQCVIDFEAQQIRTVPIDEVHRASVELRAVWLVERLPSGPELAGRDAFSVGVCKDARFPLDPGQAPTLNRTVPGRGVLC